MAALSLQKSNNMATKEDVKASAEQLEFSEENKTETAGEILLVSGPDDAVRLIPVPTSDPNDPLNFSKWRKAGVTITCCWFCKLFVLDLIEFVC